MKKQPFAAVPKELDQIVSKVLAFRPPTEKTAQASKDDKKVTQMEHKPAVKDRERAAD